MLSKCNMYRKFGEILMCFYPRGASDARVIAIIVCLCVTRRYCIKTVKHRITRTMPRDSPGTLVFWCQKLLVDDPLPLVICAQWPTHRSKPQFRPIFAQSASTVRSGKKSSNSTNRKSTMHFPMSHRWTVYVNPKWTKRWHKTRFSYLFQ